MSTRPARLLVVALLVAACGQDSMADDTAEVRVDGDDAATFTLDACGVDEDTLLMLGRNGDDELLQIAVGVVATDDGFEADGDEVGFSIDSGSGTVAAFTPPAWDRRGDDGDAPGEVTSVELRGSRLRLSARAERSDSATTVDVEVEARCDGADDVA